MAHGRESASVDHVDHTHGIPAVCAGRARATHRMHGWMVVVTYVVALLFAACAFAPLAPHGAHSASPTPRTTSRQTSSPDLGALAGTAPLLGVTRPGFSSLHPQAIDAYTQLAGRSPGIVMFYTRTTSAFNVAWMDAIAARGAVPMNSASICGGTDSPCSDAAIANGSQDGALHAYARAAATWQRPMFYRFAWEMNGTWEAFAPGQQGNTVEAYIAMWRHVVTLFRQDGATNVRFVWCPNAYAGAATPIDFTALYPGDAYVDWLGLDGYNWGATKAYSRWTSFSDIFGRSYDALIHLTERPIMIAETASVESGGDKAAWIDAVASDLTTKFRSVRAVVWFDNPVESGTPTQLNIDSSATALAAYRRMANAFAGAAS